MSQKADPKVLKAVIKEGGKRGVEIEGAAVMGGLRFFCAKVDEPNGDIEMLRESVKAMNAVPDEEEEERRGGSGEIGKMIFSAAESQLAVYAYVPKNEAEHIDAKEWLANVLGQFDGEVVGGDSLEAWGVIKANADKGVFPLKVRDVALPKAIEYLRTKKLFPEAKDDSSDDEMIFGDDTDYNDFQ